MAGENSSSPFVIKTSYLDGNADGLRLVEMPPFTGRMVIFPCDIFDECKAKHPELFDASGVYFLSGLNETDAPTIHIGASDKFGECIKKRIVNPLGGKPFWKLTTMFSCADEPLTPGQAAHLAHKLVKIAKKGEGYAVKNDQNPLEPRMSVSETIVMEKHLQTMQTILHVIGINLSSAPGATPTHEKKMDEPMDEPHDIFTLQGRADARGYPASGNFPVYKRNMPFVVCKGSAAIKDTADSIHSSAIKAREQLLELGVLIEEKNGDFSFTKDHKFPSPSRAAAVCCGSSQNGLDVWKNKRGKSLNDLKRAYKRR